MSSSSPSSIARYLHRLCDNSLNTGIFETETVERLLTLTLDASNVDEAAELEQAYDKVLLAAAILGRFPCPDTLVKAGKTNIKIIIILNLNLCSE